jgi:hypothetical protein
MYYHQMVAQELYRQQVAEWEREARIRRTLKAVRQARARRSSPATGAGRSIRPARQTLPEVR